MFKFFVFLVIVVSLVFCCVISFEGLMWKMLVICVILLKMFEKLSLVGVLVE